ncbi:FAD-dependent oxidoreductase [Deinococcus soli (ex Cha et al. 2016)]|uniref:Ferredoxin--NADP+ reductase n=2 Tax=Deinococcus soli (ex Cha et al. 2016) TaxID=1309411 RepID=A0ACC6KIQ4_9DEIO|nr:FAD-dependent oxidoreductase [Deinococcus soli (ex Cha et al. 2016)]MDR6219457.1 ferredoxin--NADP+ reductase [Deinococcus soli (ex Cha et al. 2016)]MDR6327136.1 ferredoxin--NADP+ reductase [Deinococcus soli (ex Cha et al. 2016)]MDR6752398.1 ferredoxin--NADP+ reductase [Deinococcus soli (ex Cha et al. 2016)]
MTQTYTPERPLRVAVIGSGPSGIFATEALLKQTDLPAQVDVYDRLPTPYGLVRYGVAPDHLTIKSVTRGFEKTLGDPRVRFLGNVEFGTDLTHEDALTHYDAVLYTVGASSDRRLGIPGEDLTGSMSATEFVAWYNGHPDAAAREMVLSASGVAVVGVGNVALDVSRILVKTAQELHESDIAAHALTALDASHVQDVWVLGRRGPAQAAFTTKELREFGELHAAEPVVKPEEIALSEAEEAAITDNTKKKNVEVLRDFAAREAEGKARRVHLRFLVSPVEILDDGQGRVGGLKVERNRLDENGNAVGTGEFEVLPVQMVLRSVGYRGVALPGVPFDEKRGVIANDEGRVVGRVGEYTAGWIKRGPSGVVGTNRKDATDTVAHLLADAKDGKLPGAAHPTREAVDALLRGKGVQVYSFHDWQVLDAHELAEGQAQGRPRAKVVHRDLMLGHRKG